MEYTSQDFSAPSTTSCLIVHFKKVSPAVACSENTIFVYIPDAYSYYLVSVPSALGSPAIALSGSVQVVCFGLWEQHNEDAERRAHAPAGRVG